MIDELLLYGLRFFRIAYTSNEKVKDCVLVKLHCNNAEDGGKAAVVSEEVQPFGSDANVANQIAIKSAVHPHGQQTVLPKVVEIYVTSAAGNHVLKMSVSEPIRVRVKQTFQQYALHTPVQFLAHMSPSLQAVRVETAAYRKEDGASRLAGHA